MSEILAVATRMCWVSPIEENWRKFAPAGEFIIQALVEIECRDRDSLIKSFLAGGQAGANAFNQRGSDFPKPVVNIQAAAPIDIPASRLLMLDLTAIRCDLRRHHPMTKIEILSAAYCALAEMEKTLSGSSKILALGWSPSKGPATLPLLASSLRRAALGGSIEFPRSDFPDLALLMEQWDVASASGPATAPSSRLRI